MDCNGLVSLLKLKQVRALTALGTTSIYEQAKSGLFPPRIKLTARSSAWVLHEVAAVNAARAAGLCDREIRALVRDLVASRRRLLVELTSLTKQSPN